MNLDQIKANKALVRRVIEEVWNKGDLLVIPQVYAPNAVIYYNGAVQDFTTLNAFVSEIRGAFPDFYDTIDDQVAEGNKVATRVTSVGTHLGVLRDIQPTKKRASWMAIGIDRIEEGKIIEEWLSGDVFELLKQLKPRFWQEPKV